MWQRVLKIQSQFQLIELFHEPEVGHIRLDINTCTQFHSADEYRYHELAMLTPFVIAKKEPKRVLILGGGDGLAAREALKYAEKITLVDIDPEITRLARENPLLRALNQDALNDERVKIYNKDAFYWIKECRKNKFDVCFADYPDPSSPSLDKLFSLEHYEDIKRALKPEGILVVQSAGLVMLPVMATIGKKLKKIFKNVIPLKVEMLGGVQGFWLATDEDIEFHWERLEKINTRAFDRQMLLSATSFGKDFREALKQGSAEESVYDAYVYGMCLAKYLKCNAF